MQCETRHISIESCTGAFIPEVELEQIVINELRAFNLQLLDIEKLKRLTDFESVLNLKKQRVVSELSRFQMKVDECNNAIKQLYADKTAAIITFKDYLDLSASFQADKSRYENMIQDCEEQICQIDTNLLEGDHGLKRLEPYVHLEHLTRGMVESLVERIEVGKRNRETGCVPVRITWAF